jgi:S-formylglutathione hydrolase
MGQIERVEQHQSFGGDQFVVRHDAVSTGCPMTFAVYVPPQAKAGVRLPVVTYLSGLTCTHTNVMDKGEYRRLAAQLGLVVVCPDTSPRGEGVPDDPAYDFGQGAGFYLDAVMAPWDANFRMFSYITRDLPAVLTEHFPVDLGRHGIFGHSMGGHGALVVGLREPELFKSVSAFSPIVNPSAVPWGRKAFGGYLGLQEDQWRRYDAVSLIQSGLRVRDILVDVGTADPFLERELTPEALEAACAVANIPLTLRRQVGYDHSYFFISSFMGDHLRWHAERLQATGS